MRTQASLEFLASLLMPADAGKRGVLIQATETWQLDEERLPGDADIVVWGAWTARAERGITMRDISTVLKRELALRTIRHRLRSGLVKTHVHRLPRLDLRQRQKPGRVSAAIFGGALVEFQRATGTTRILDELTMAAGGSAEVAHIWPGAGVSAWARARRTDDVDMLLRMGAIGGRNDPQGAAECLDRLEAAGVGRVPRLISRGRRDLVSWTAESIVAGKTPMRLTPSLAADAGRFLATLPMSRGHATAPSDDLLALRKIFPSRGREIEALVARIDPLTRTLPGVLRHGDLWIGNLLAERGSLTGVIDWDAWHPEGVPGADLMYLAVKDRAWKTGRSSGEIWSEDPWRLPAFRAASLAYWPLLSLAAPEEELLQAIAIAGWAAQVAATLRRVPSVVSTPRWVNRNIESFLAVSRS